MPGHGHRYPSQVWTPTQELRRRFQPELLGDVTLLPVLPASFDSLLDDARACLDFLGVRRELTQDTFLPDDCAAVFGYLERLYQELAPSIERRHLREVVKPTYRHVVELMPPVKKRGPWHNPGARLAEVKLLEHDGDGGFRFTPAKRVRFAGRRETRDRLTGTLWTFVIEGLPAARAPLRDYFGVSILEEEIIWTPDKGEAALDDEQLEGFRAELTQQGAWLLCLLEASRATSKLVTQDVSRFKRLVRLIEPVQRLSASCSLGAATSTQPRHHLVDRTQDVVLVAWDPTPWADPLPESLCEALATAVCEYLEVNEVLPFMALLGARDDDARERILRRAGAPHGQDRQDKLDVLRSVSQEPAQRTSHLASPQVRVAVAHDDEVQPPPNGSLPHRPPARSEPRPLYSPADLVIDGQPVTIHGTDSGPSTARDPGRGGSGGDGGDGGDGGGSNQPAFHTDLEHLNHLGMVVAMRFEAHRIGLRRMGTVHHRDPAAMVFDVSTSVAIRDGRRDAAFASAFDALVEQHDLNPAHPGFDILTLADDLSVERCIELKSSGENARKQSMTWNEWKTSSDSTLASRFYLYLVGNLRSDLPTAAPFVRTVQDPVGQLRAQKLESTTREQAVQLDVRSFESADELVLDVAPSSRSAGRVGKSRDRSEST